MTYDPAHDCYDPTHDHLEADGKTPLVCADCGHPLHYDDAVDDYRHDATDRTCGLHLEGGGCMTEAEFLELEAEAEEDYELRHPQTEYVDEETGRHVVRLSVYDRSDEAELVGSRLRHPASST